MKKRSAAVWFLTLVTTVCAACGGAPTSPAPVQPLPFRAGGYVLILGAASTDCHGEPPPQAGIQVAVEVTLSADLVRGSGVLRFPAMVTSSSDSVGPLGRSLPPSPA